jgi:hypothetical protein
MISLGEHAKPMVISSMMSGLMKMSILTVEEMLAMFPSSKALGGRNRVLEPVNMPQRNKILCFDCTHGGLIWRVKYLLREKKCSMMECIPREIRSSQLFQDIFVAVENVRIQGILGDDRGNCQWVSVIFLKG